MRSDPLAGNGVDARGADDERHVRLLIERWAEAVRDGDMERILARHTDDVVMFDVPPPLRADGIAAYEETWRLFFDSVRPGKDALVLEDLAITAGDDVAFAHALLRISGSSEPVCRLTIGLKKVRGAWTIAHEHHSAPYAP